MAKRQVSSSDLPNIGPAASTDYVSILSGEETTSDYVGPSTRMSIPGKGTTALDVANRIVEFCNAHGDVVTNLKLQKLLYYAQAWHLAISGKRLFPEDFEAWPIGPVQPEIYARFAKFGRNPIESTQPIRLSASIEKHIENVMQAYGHLSSYDLERLSCSELPWMEARGNLPPEQTSTNTIDPATMKAFYKIKANGKKQKQK